MTIEDRLVKLEKTIRWQRIALFAFAALIAVGFIAAAGPVQPVIRTRGIEVVNDKGQLVGYFGQMEGTVKLVVYDPVVDGRAVALEVKPKVAGLVIEDGKNSVGVFIPSDTKDPSLRMIVGNRETFKVP
jgi:hypothetical protein